MLSVVTCVVEGTKLGEIVLAATSIVVDAGIVDGGTVTLNADGRSIVVSLDGVAICVAGWSPHALAIAITTTRAEATRRTVTLCAD